MKVMLELKGKYCKDCKIFTDNIESEALSMVYKFINHPMFEGAKIRIMPDVHAGRDIVVGFTVPFSDHVNPDHVGGDIGCSVSTSITDLPVDPERYPAIERRIRETVKFGMSIHDKAVYPYAELYRHLQTRLTRPDSSGLRWSILWMCRREASPPSFAALTSRSICSITA